MANSNFSCTICVESYTSSDDICCTVCGHIFHFQCLREWLLRSNKCPMCNRSNPEPHRIYLDLGAITERTSNNDAKEFDVMIKGFKPNQLKTPLSKTVLELAINMNVHLTENDIRNALRIGNSIGVTFKSALHRDLFLRNKFKLKNSPETSKIVIHEVLDPVMQALFEYSHKLKTNGYKTIFVNNGKVFVKKERNGIPINIVSKEQVDALCVQVMHEMSTTSQVQHIGKRKNAVHRNTNENTFGRATASHNIHNNGAIGRATNTQIYRPTATSQTYHSSENIRRRTNTVRNFNYEDRTARNKTTSECCTL